MESPAVAATLQEGGGDLIQLKLHDIGDYSEVDDFRPMISGSLVSMNIALALGRMGALKSNSFNTYFDTFGLEGILANTSLVVLIIQAARWLYTRFYTAGQKPWSPLVFMAVLLATQVSYDLLFYFGIVNQLPPGNNEMVDALKAYAKENGPRALGGQSIFVLVAAFFAMLLKEVSFVTSFVIVTATFYLLPYIISIIAPRNQRVIPMRTAAETQEHQGQQKQAAPKVSMGGNGPLAGPTIMSPKKEAPFTMYSANGMLV
jgi:hypothetical protein